MQDNQNIVDIANNYIYPKTLEAFLESNMLIEYLKALDEDSIEYAMDYIEAEELTEIRKLILSLINKEFQIRDENRRKVKYPSYIGRHIITEKRTLTIFLANHKLTDYLQTLTDNELDQAERNLYMDDIVGDALEILCSIRIEKEYRTQEKLNNKQKVV